MEQQPELPSIEQFLSSIEEQNLIIVLDKNLAVKILTEHTRLMVENYGN